MGIITKYTDYAILTPDFIINFIQKEMNNRDLNGVTGGTASTKGRIPSIRVTGEHPFMNLVGSILQTGKAQYQGLLPSISVIEGDEDEEFTTLGQGMRTGGIIGLDFLSDIRDNHEKMVDRVNEGIITDTQLNLIETVMKNNNDQLYRSVETYKEREVVFISLWANTLDERKILSKVLRSVIYDMRKELSANNVIDTVIRTSKGLTNFDFGRMLFGQETQISFLNTFSNYTISDEIPQEREIDIEGEFKANDGSESYVKIDEGCSQ